MGSAVSLVSFCPEWRWCHCPNLPKLWRAVEPGSPGDRGTVGGEPWGQAAQEMGAQRGRRRGQSLSGLRSRDALLSPPCLARPWRLQSQGLGTIRLASLGLRAFWTCPV